MSKALRAAFQRIAHLRCPESTDAWEDFLVGLLRRGLRPPLLVISDGAPGIIATCELVLGRSLRQRCVIHWSRKESRCCFALVRSLSWYGDQAGDPSQLGDRFAVLLPHLNERQRRLAVATEARLLGRGGVRAVARTAGMSETTVRRGVEELEAAGSSLPIGRIRAPGGGRRVVETIDPGVVDALLALVEPEERGDPMSPLRWTTKSLRHLADELTRQGHRVSAPTVGRLLRAAGFSLQANAKTLEGTQHPDRDAQFRYINEQVKDHQADGQPVVSVDTKKREHLGRLPMAGREWRPAGDPVQVEDHHFYFTGPDVEQAIPFGIYDLARDTGWVGPSWTAPPEAGAASP
jgi:transposase